MSGRPEGGPEDAERPEGGLQRFGARLAAAVTARGPLCAGIDPHPGLLEAWGLADDARGLESFALTATEVLAAEVAVVKPQSAFFESYGSAGIAVLERVIGLARDAGALVLLDVKRGDIGSTMQAYARAYLSGGSPLAVDAVTVSPFLSFDSLAPALRTARDSGRGVFVLARTSNRDSGEIQNAKGEQGKTVAQSIVDEAARHNRDQRPLGHVGVVIGATLDGLDLDLSELNGPILAPGFGAQGATAADLRRVFGPHLPNVLPASAREILGAGPDPAALRDTVRRTNESLLRQLA